MSGGRCRWLCEATTMRRSGLPEGHSIARVTAHDCDCHVRRLTSRIGGWSDGKETTELTQRQESRSFCRRAVPSLGGQIRSTRALWGSKRGAFPFERRREAARRQFLLERLRNEGRSEERTKAPHPRKTQQSFSSFSCSFLFSTPQTSTTNTANMLIYKVRLPDC